MQYSRCPFEKAILSTRFGCGQAEKYSVAEREGVQCRNPLAEINCSTLIEYFRENARFALKLADPAVPVSHGKEMQIRCGGLLGLQALVGANANAPGVDDIHALVRETMARYGGLARIPYGEVVKHIAGYQHRRRTPGR